MPTRDPHRLPSDATLAFVVGPPRSGTTWMQCTLDAHPRILCGGETNFAPDLLYPIYQHITAYARAHNINVNIVGTDRQDSIPSFTPDSARAALRAIAETLLTRYLALGEQRGTPDPAVIADKSPSNTRHVHLLAELFPEARFVCCVRDVRDAAVSMFLKYQRDRARGRPGAAFLRPCRDIFEATEHFARTQWAEMLRFARAAGERLGPDRFLEIDYAEHHDHPHDVVRRLFAFLGVDHDDATVDAAVDATSFERMSGGRRRGVEGDSDVRRGTLGDWQNHLPHDFGDHLLEVARQRLALGETPASNTLVSTWSGRHAAHAA